MHALPASSVTTDLSHTVHPRLGADGPCPDAGIVVGEPPFF